MYQSPIQSWLSSMSAGDENSPLKEKNKNLQQHGGLKHKKTVAKRSAVVFYDTNNHLQILFQQYGSVRSFVYPYCLVTMLITLICYYLVVVSERKGYYDDFIAFDPQGHVFMGTLVAFSMIMRVKTSYDGYMAAGKALGMCLHYCEQIVQHAAVFTMDDYSEDAVKWRNNVAHRTIILLRVTIAAINFENSCEPAYKSSTLTDYTKKKLSNFLMLDSDDNVTSKRKRQSMVNFLKHDRKAQDAGIENARAPVMCSYWLKKMIHTHFEELEDAPLSFNHQRILINDVESYMKNYSTLFTHRLPFPMIQMSRTFLFAWIFSLPMALISVIKRFLPLLGAVLLLTYGFMGLEVVAMQMDDPWGDDPNDFDDHYAAEITTRKIYSTILDVNGKEAATELENSLDRTDIMNKHFAAKIYGEQRPE